MPLKVDVQNMVATINLNGSEQVVDGVASNFSVMLLRVYMKSDPTNRAKIKALWPNLVAVYESWKNGPPRSTIAQNFAPHNTDHILDLPYDGPMDRPPTNWKLFPIQHDDLGPIFNIPWDVAKLAFEVYHRMFPDQTLEDIAKRGGFSWAELIIFLKPKVEGIPVRYIQ